MDAYQKVKEAQRAVINGEKKPDNCPVDVWEVLTDMYGKKNR